MCRTSETQNPQGFSSGVKENHDGNANGNGSRQKVQ